MAGSIKNKYLQAPCHLRAERANKGTLFFKGFKKSPRHGWLRAVRERIISENIKAAYSIPPGRSSSEYAFAPVPQKLNKCQEPMK